jgi:hypothetical protein
MEPYVIFPAVSGDWGEVHELILDDEVTRAEYALETGGAAFASYWLPHLDRIIRQKTWRSEAALEIYLRITRQMGEMLSTSKTQPVATAIALRRVYLFSLE